MFTFLASSALFSAFRGGLGAAAGRAVTHASADWAAIPPKAKLAIVAALAAIFLFFIHQHVAHKAIAAARLEQKQADDAATAKMLAHVAAEAQQVRIKAEQLHASIANLERTHNEQVLRSNAADADALKLRGPGAASAAGCRPLDHPGAPSASDRSVDAAPQAGAAAAQMPSDDRAIVPWKWLVQIVKEHDDLLSDVATVIDNDKKQRAAWPGQPQGSSPASTDTRKP